MKFWGFFLVLTMTSLAFAENRIGTEQPSDVKKFMHHLESGGFSISKTYGVTYPDSVIDLKLSPSEAFEVTKEKNGRFNITVVKPEALFKEDPVAGKHIRTVKFYPTYAGAAAATAPEFAAKVTCAATLSFTGKNNTLFNFDKFLKDGKWSEDYSYEVVINNPELAKVKDVLTHTVTVNRMKSGNATAQLIVRSKSDSFLAKSEVVNIPECALLPQVAKRKTTRKRRTSRLAYNRSLNPNIYAGVSPASDSLSLGLSAVKKETVTKTETKINPRACITLAEEASEQVDNTSKEKIVWKNSCDRPVQCQVKYFAKYSTQLNGPSLAQSSSKKSPLATIAAKGVGSVSFNNNGNPEYNSVYDYVTYENTGSSPECRWAPVKETQSKTVAQN